MARAGCSRRILSLGRFASTGEAGLSLVLSPGAQKFLQGTLLWCFLVGVYFSGQITLNTQGSCYFTQ